MLMREGLIPNSSEALRGRTRGQKRERKSAPAPAEMRFSEDEIGRLFRPWEAARGFLLAVSGGPDSVALMLLAVEWARGRAVPPLFVATVDHGLREDSRQEAEMVADWAASLSLPHAILVWHG